ncbi:MAG: leucine/isoleucine/valine transporter permease subunit, partial [Chloroflexi bacterium]|nr:leucine/isoleucine/valine transporter permease subunit [Chloroflexota bacterium]
MSAVLLVSLMEPFLNNVFLQLRQNALASFIYERSGLTIPAALIVFVVVLAVAAFETYRGKQARERVESLPAPTRRNAKYVTLFFVGVLLLVLPHLMGVFLSEVVGTVGLYMLMGLGLNIVVGYAGLLDLGYVAFFAVGAYATALLTSPASSLGLGLDFWIALPIVMVIAAIT